MMKGSYTVFYCSNKSNNILIFDISEIKLIEIRLIVWSVHLKRKYNHLIDI